MILFETHLLTARKFTKEEFGTRPRKTFIHIHTLCRYVDQLNWNSDVFVFFTSQEATLPLQYKLFGHLISEFSIKDVKNELKIFSFLYNKRTKDEIVPFTVKGGRI